MTRFLSEHSAAIFTFMVTAVCAAAVLRKADR